MRRRLTVPQPAAHTAHRCLTYRELGEHMAAAVVRMDQVATGRPAMTLPVGLMVPDQPTGRWDICPPTEVLDR